MGKIVNKNNNNVPEDVIYYFFNFIKSLSLSLLLILLFIKINFIIKEIKSIWYNQWWKKIGYER